MDNKQKILSEMLFLAGALTKEAACGNEIINKCFNALGLNDQEVKQLYDSSFNEEVMKISRVSDYFRYCRVQQYYEMTRPTFKPINNEEISVKGEILRELEAINLGAISEMMLEKRVSALTAKANEGFLTAKFILALAYFNGTCVERNIPKSMELLYQSARWGHIHSIVALCSYDDKFKQEYMSYVYSVLKDTPYNDLFKCIYGEVEPPISQERVILRELFAKKLLDSQKYDESYCKLLFDKHININEKHYLLTCCPRESVVRASSLSICVKDGAIKLNNADKAELEPDIAKALNNTDIRSLDNYKPLCFLTKSPQATAKYISWLQDLYINESVHIIHLADCMPYELEPSCNNVLAMLGSDDKHQIVIIVCEGKNISPAYMEAAKNYAQATKRGRFKLIQPPITLNLRGVLPIYICDEHNSKSLKDECQLLEIKLKEESKEAFVADFIRSKEQCYRIEKISLTKECMDTVLSWDYDIIERVLDDSIMVQRNGAMPIELSCEMVVKAFKKDKPTVRCGFN